MKKKLLSIDDVFANTSKTRVYEKKPLQSGVIIFVFCLLVILLVLCFVMDELFSDNQVAFLGIFGASVISVFTIIVTLNHEKRSDYIAARKSALMLSNILDSLYSQIEMINSGDLFLITYPNDWMHYYENCCTYLRYNYLPYLLHEFDIMEKLNKCIEKEDKTSVKKLLEYRKKSITDWMLDFDIFSAKMNLLLFASGNLEKLPWTHQEQYKEFKKYIIETYEDKIKQLTISYLEDHGGHSDAVDAEYYVMKQLRTEASLQTGKYGYIALENRAMLSAIFSVYLFLKPEDAFGLCWGELSLKR